MRRESSAVRLQCNIHLKLKGWVREVELLMKHMGVMLIPCIQNASAQVSHNVCDLSEIVRDSFSLLLFVIGLALICYFVTNLIKVLADYFAEDIVRAAGVATETSSDQEVSSSEYATKLPNPTVAPYREEVGNEKDI